MSTLRHNRHAVLITEAPLSADEEFSSRRRRYLVMMFGRAGCVIGAVLVFHFSGWLAAAFLVAAAVLPWAAVLLANNRPAKQAVRFRRFLPTESGPAQLNAAGGPPSGTTSAPDGHWTDTASTPTRPSDEVVPDPRVIDL